jgi:hypothetical protein
MRVANASDYSSDESNQRLMMIIYFGQPRWTREKRRGQEAGGAGVRAARRKSLAILSKHGTRKGMCRAIKAS